MPKIDLLVYHDFTDTIQGSPPAVGTPAKEWLGDSDEFTGLYVVALGPAIHDSKDITVVLGGLPHGMADVQERLNRPINQ